MIKRYSIFIKYLFDSKFSFNHKLSNVYDIASLALKSSSSYLNQAIFFCSTVICNSYGDFYYTKKVLPEYSEFIYITYHF